MTNNQKLHKLMLLAVEKGWNYLGLSNNEKFDVIVDFKEVIVYRVGYREIIPINDFILDWTEDKLSFIDALCSKNNIKTDTNTIVADGCYNEQLYFPVKNEAQHFQFEWVSLPTSKRLEHFFKTFDHLLN